MLKIEKLMYIALTLLIISSAVFAGSKDEIDVDLDQDEKSLVPFQEKYHVTQETKKVSRLSISDSDLLWEFSGNGKFVDLVIRKKKWIGSVMLTNMYFGEKYIDEYGRKVYGLRARTYNSVNGRELRLVGKKAIGRKKDQLFLVDSHPEKHPVFGAAFRIRIPRIVEYGYKNPNENHGVISIEKGTTLNLRTYVRKYADHRGKFENNPIPIDFSEEDYRERLKPEMAKVKEYQERGDFKVAMVKFKSRVNYVKYFLIRDIYIGEKFKKVGFSRYRNKSHRRVVVLRAIRNQRGGVTITALIYFKKGSAEKEYAISAIDQKNRVAGNFVTVVVPQVGHTKKIGEEMKKEDENIIFNDGSQGEDIFKEK